MDTNYSSEVLSVRIFAIAAFLCLFLNSCGDDQPEPQELTEVSVGITTSFLGEAATFTAMEQGFFEEHGLNVSLSSNPSGAVSLREMLNNNVDIAHVAETPIAYALLDSSYIKGDSLPDFQIFADMVYASEIQHIVGRKDHGISGATDLMGERVAILKNTQLKYFLDSFLLEYQQRKSKIDLVNMKPSEQVQAIIDGRVSVAVVWEPYATYILQKLGDNAVVLEPKLSYSTLWMATTLDSYAERNPKVLVSYLKALERAQRYIEEYPEQTIKLLAKKTGVPVDAVRANWQKIDYELSLSTRMITLLEDQARWIQRNQQPDLTIPDFKKLVNFNPMRSVNPQGITVIR